MEGNDHQQKLKPDREIGHFSRFMFGNRTHRATHKENEPMEGNDYQQKPKPNREIDHFSRFLFGNREHRRTYKENENNSQEFLEKNEHTSFEKKSNRNDDWGSGIRRKEPESSAQTLQNQIENLLNNVDFELLMETYDALVVSSKPLKPLMKEITPFFHRIRKKLKSK